METFLSSVEESYGRQGKPVGWGGVLQAGSRGEGVKGGKIRVYSA